MAYTPLSEFPVELCQLNELQLLALNNTNIKEIPACISQLSKLKELRLHHTNIEALPQEFEQLQNIEILTLDYSLLDPIPDCLKQFPALKRLIIFLDNNQQAATNVKINFEKLYPETDIIYVNVP